MTPAEWLASIGGIGGLIVSLAALRKSIAAGREDEIKCLRDDVESLRIEVAPAKGFADIQRQVLEAYRQVRDTAEQAARDLRGIEAKLENVVFWKDISKVAAASLHSPHRPELDELIEKYQREEIDYPELVRLSHLLRELLAKVETSKGEKFAAQVLMSDLERRYQLR